MLLTLLFCQDQIYSCCFASVSNLVNSHFVIASEKEPPLMAVHDKQKKTRSRVDVLQCWRGDEVWDCLRRGLQFITRVCLTWRVSR